MGEKNSPRYYLAIFSNDRPAGQSGASSTLKGKGSETDGKKMRGVHAVVSSRFHAKEGTY